MARVVHVLHVADRLRVFDFAVAVTFLSTVDIQILSWLGLREIIAESAKTSLKTLNKNSEKLFSFVLV